jgi:hypothetical protein
VVSSLERSTFRELAFFTIAGTVLSLTAWCADAPGVPVSVVVTVETKGEAAVLTRDDLRVKENKKDRPITEFRRLESGKAQMLLLIDDSAGESLDSSIPDLKKFVNSLPANEGIGVAYMHNGEAQMVSEFTADHGKAANSIRLSRGVGGGDVSPYDSLADAAKKWPKDATVERREVVMISSGLEGLGGGLPPDNPYVNAGITAAQKAGLIVYAIYNPSAGHEGHSFWRASWGQNFLSQLADETGGELYAVGFGSAVSYEPYLNDILKRQGDQYIVTFGAGPENKSEFQPVKITSTLKGTSIAAPDKVFVKASM